MGVKSQFVLAAALAGVLSATHANAEDKKSETKSESKTVMGECHGVNACKGTGDCGGKDTSCAGSNGCKGKGWKKMSQEECNKAKGKFKADAQ